MHFNKKSDEFVNNENLKKSFKPYKHKKGKNKKLFLTDRDTKEISNQNVSTNGLKNIHETVEESKKFNPSKNQGKKKHKKNKRIAISESVTQEQLLPLTITKRNSNNDENKQFILSTNRIKAKYKEKKSKSVNLEGEQLLGTEMKERSNTLDLPCPLSSENANCNEDKQISSSKRQNKKRRKKNKSKAGELKVLEEDEIQKTKIKKGKSNTSDLLYNLSSETASNEEAKQFIPAESSVKKKRVAIDESGIAEEQEPPKTKVKKKRSDSFKVASDSCPDKEERKKQYLKSPNLKNSKSEFDLDSYSSGSESDSGNDAEITLKGNTNNARDSSDDSSSEDDVSKSSQVSEFDVDSYPSDTDEEIEKKRGLPENATPSAELEEKEKRTIFVGNLPYLVERPELKKWFSKFGKVECVRLRSAPLANLEIPRKVAVIKKTFHQDRSNIHAYIRFCTVESAENAIQANGALFKDHVLRVDHSRHEGKYDTKKAVFVGNVPFSLEEDNLRQFFSECGDIESIRIVRDKNTGVGKGFAYVNFTCSTSVPLALKLDGEILEKRELRVKPVKYAKKNVKPVQQYFSTKKMTGHHFKQFKNNKLQKKSSKFQGEMSKKKFQKTPKKKSALDRKREKFSKIFTSKSQKER